MQLLTEKETTIHVNCTSHGLSTIGWQLRNSLNTLLIRGLIGDLECKNTPFKAKYLKKAMFVDSHTQNSNINRVFGRDVSFCSLSEDIHCRWLRWSEVRLYQNKIIYNTHWSSYIWHFMTSYLQSHQICHLDFRRTMKVAFFR